MRLHRLAVVSALALACLGSPSIAKAQGDAFGVGDGHSGPRSVTAPETIVNTYGGVAEDIAAGATTITTTTQLVGGGAFTAKDLVLVWRASGVADSEAPSGNQTKRLDLASALATTSTTLSAGAVGRYELARIKSVSGPVLTLEQPMQSAFAKTRTQIVRVPEFTTVNVAAGASLVAAPWQQLTTGAPDYANPDPNAQWVGGIVVFLANGAITNDGAIHANGRGFHGATPEQRLISSLGLFCDGSSVDGDPSATTGAFAPKGEGVVSSKFRRTSGGKGNIANAGGGGNCLESGGGGGANQGNGGNGSAVLGATSNGLGGVGLDYDLFQRLSMGGGGGAGRHIVGLASQVSFGGFGGGVIYIRGTSIAGKGVLQANGANGEDSGLAGLPQPVVSESSGGGGAGGSIVVRLTGDLDCSQLNSNGGNGGSAQVAGLPVLGAGGGGGGGRVLFQAASKSGSCNVTVTPGGAGNSQGGGAQPGQPGTTVPDLPPLCIPASPGVPGTCPDASPVCDPTSGQCTRCSGPFGSGPPDPCEVATKPVCNGTDGTCHPCDGDFGGATPNACQLANAPTCFTTGDQSVAGSCGKCTKDADCTTGTHPGPTCDVASGACGTACTKDEDCQPTQWCAPTNPAVSTAGVCVPKVPNSQPVPTNPPIDGECTPANGQRTCLSAVCEESDDLCGKKNSSPCGDPNQCRSSICFSDKLCGLPNGQPCTGSGQCRSDLCKDGVCSGKPCGSDTDCPAPGQVCDPATNTCVDGCRPGLSTPADGGVVNGVCPPGAACVSPDGGPIGNCQTSDAGIPDGGGLGGPGDSGLTLGLIEGGGCSCSSTISSATSPLALLGGAAGVMLLFRRRGTRKRRG